MYAYVCTNSVAINTNICTSIDRCTYIYIYIYMYTYSTHTYVHSFWLGECNYLPLLGDFYVSVYTVVASRSYCTVYVM